MTSRMEPLARAGLASLAALQSWARNITAFMQRSIVEATFSATDEATNARDITITLRDRVGRSVVGRWPIDVWITDSEDGAPSATGNTVSVLTGTTLQTYTANAAYRLLTDATGVAEIRLTITGAATRRVYATAGGEALDSGALAWT